MTYTRREFLKTGSAAAALGLVGRIDTNRLTQLERVGPEAYFAADPDLKAIALRVLDAAKSDGAQYSDVRITSGMERRTVMSGRRVSLSRLTVELQISVRVLVNGAWGFSSSREVTDPEAVRLAKLAVRQAKMNPFAKPGRVELAPTPVVPNGQWTAPIDADPWTKRVQDQLTLQLEADELLVKLAEAKKDKNASVFSQFNYVRQDYAFASSEGSYITQVFNNFGGYYNINVVADDRNYSAGLQPDRFKTGFYGWEAIDGIPWRNQVEKTYEEAKAMTRGKPADPGKFDIVLDAQCTAAVAGSSICVALEYDRVLGYEMHGSGTSALGPANKTLGQYSFKNKNMNLRAVPYVERQGPYKWDAEGVPPEAFDVVKDGVVVDYFTTREFAPQLAWWYKQQNKPVRSHGCASSSGSAVIQVVMPTPTILAPNPARDVSVEELASKIKKGYFFKGGSASMDPAGMNMEVYGSQVKEISNGKIGDFVKYAAFQCRTPDFWKSADQWGGKSTVDWGGAGGFKGDPGQLYGISVNAPAVGAKQMNVINFGRRG